MQNNYNQWQNQSFQGGGQMSGYSHSNPNQNAIQVNGENNASGYQQQYYNALPMWPMSIVDAESPERIFYEPNINVLYYEVVGIKSEPSPRIKQRAICDGRPIKIKYLKYDERYNREEDAVVTWLTTCGVKIEVTCPRNKLSSKTFIDCLVNSGATQMHGSDSAMRNAARIVSYINDPNRGVDTEMWIIPYNAGWINRRNYIAYSAKPNNLNSGINRNLLLDDCFRAEKSAVYDIIGRLEIFRDESNGIILLAYLVSAFLRPFYKGCGYELKSILLTPDNSSEMSKVLSAFLKIYNTDSDSTDTISNQRELTNILYNHKDDVVILNETSVREDGISKVYGFLTDTVKTGKYSRNENEYKIETMIGYRIRYKIKEYVFITLSIEDVAERTADIFKEKFHLGSKQYYTLKDAICVVLNQNEAATLADIGAYLTKIKEYDLRNKLDRLLGKDYCGKCEIDWNEVLYGKPTLTIFQMSGLNDVKYLLAEFILMDFMRYVKQNGNEEKQCVLWADECQELKNYKHFSMHDILTTNRKFGVNQLCFARNT